MALHRLRARSAGILIGTSLTLTTGSRLRSGPTLREAVETIDERTGGVAAWFGTNCSHPLEFEAALADDGAWTDRLRYIRPNAVKMEKVALCKLGHLEDGDPVELGQQMGDVARRFPAPTSSAAAAGRTSGTLPRSPRM